MWRLWAKALGEKFGNSDKEADKIACIRTIIIVSYIITNMFIVAGVIRHWNGQKEKSMYDIYLEDMIMADMIVNGYDITDPLDIEAYWEMRLS